MWVQSELAQNLLDPLPGFQADGQKDGFHGPGMRHVNPGACRQFSPGKEAVKCLLVFFAQSPPKWFPPFPFRFKNMTIGQNCLPISPSHQIAGDRHVVPRFLFRPWMTHPEESIWIEDVISFLKAVFDMAWRKV
jgi:hypothetical protein